MIAFVLSFLARSVLMQSPAGALLKGGWAKLGKIPKPVWEAAAVAGYVAAVVLLHQHYAQAAIAAARSEQRAADQAVLDGTVANYRAAAEQARQADASNKVRVEAEQRSINERTSNDFETRIADARARAERLRRQLAAAAAHSGSGGAAPVPGVPAPAGRPDEAAGQDGLPGDDALTATEQAIQLDELIKWAIRQHAVDPNAARRP